MRRAVLSVLLLTALLLPATERQKNSDYRDRRVALSRLLQGGVLVLFAPLEAEGQNDLYGFRQEDTFYYLTGWTEPGAAILIAPATGSSPYTEILFLAEHNLTQEKWTGPKLGPENPEAPKITGFDQVRSLDQIHALLLKTLPQPRATVVTDLGQEGQTAPSSTPMEWLRRSNAFPNYVSFRPAAPLIAHLRTVKDAGEIALITRATETSVVAHLAALKAIHPGVNEREIAALMQYEFGRRGCERPAYAPIVGSGFYSTVLHYSDDSQIMKSGGVVVMDVGGEYSMYATDITRTAPVNGKFTPRQREIYDIVLGAQEAAMKAFQAGKSTLGRDGPDSLYKVAYDYIDTHGKDLHGQPLGKYFIHGLGHHVGLNVHDANDPTLPLDRNMVFTIEPGIYIPEESLGVRIEDTFTVDQNGKLVLMSHGLPRTAEEVERAMEK
ncbi:MAG TPA: Xaa-Pro peptidase family protein [Candidatus Saccharimonadales bacterium]|jgi:Xaa-Pro aminopeptidase|nr:Xaa-Pro peptidase family protein [Candidatus Saccharimonadales bacterium]